MLDLGAIRPLRLPVVSLPSYLPRPAEFKEVGSFQAAKRSGPSWAHPVVGDGRLYIREGDLAGFSAFG